MLRGGAGEIVNKYLPAATLQSWRIYWHQRDRRHDGAWHLSAVITSRDPFRLRQKELLFTAPREGRMGLHCWPLIDGTVAITDAHLTATLGKPLY